MKEKRIKHYFDRLQVNIELTFFFIYLIIFHDREESKSWEVTILK